MKNLDWDKAPEGATHFNAVCFFPWLMCVPASFYRDGCWVEYKSDDVYWEDHFNNAVQRPQEWDGSDRPPIGTVCEYLWPEGKEWRKCEVVAFHNSNIVAVDVFGNTAYLLHPMMIRPIKTLEQIAAEERLRAVDEMVGLVRRYSAFKDERLLSGALYDAGYRRTEVKK